MAELGAAVGVGREVAFYALLLGLQDRLVVLNGTTNESRMRGDLEGVEGVRWWRELDGNKEMWGSILDRFREEMRKEVEGGR